MPAREVGRPARVPLDVRRVHHPARDRRPGLAARRDPDHHERQQPLRPARAELERGRRPHREPEQVEGREAERVGERLEVVDQPVVAEAVRGVPAGRRVAARVGQVAGEAPAEQRQLRGEVLAARRARAVEQEEGRAFPVHVVADLEAVRGQARHGDVGLHRGQHIDGFARHAARHVAILARPMSTAEPQPDLPKGRPFEGMADLRAMEACLARSWNLRRPFVNTTAGDLEWWTAHRPARHRLGPPRARLDRGRRGPRVRLAQPPRNARLAPAGRSPGRRAGAHRGRDAGLGVVGRPRGRRCRRRAAAPVLETWAMDADTELVGMLGARGWTAAAEPGLTALVPAARRGGTDRRARPPRRLSPAPRAHPR